MIKVNYDRNVSYHKNVENDIQQNLDSDEEDHDNSRADISQESSWIDYSTK